MPASTSTVVVPPVALAQGHRDDEPRRVMARDPDATRGAIAAFIAAFAITELAYVQILGLAGKLGFVAVWFVLYLITFTAISRIGNPWPVVVDRLAAAVVCGAALVVGLALATTIGFILVKGYRALGHAQFFTSDMAGVRPTSPLGQGGVFHAILGTLVQVGIATGLSLPLGVGTAVYMTEVGGRAARSVRTVVEAMTALPDILAGLFVYTFLILGLGWEREGFAVSVALSVTMIPIIARSAEVVLRLVPTGLREASYALGASQWQTVRRVVLPTARAGLVTSLILGVARVAGETAPLLIVSGASTFTNADPFHQPMNSLPLYVFTAIRSGEPLYIARGYGAAALLLLLVLLLFGTARYLARDKSRSR